MTLRSLLVDFNSYFASVEQQAEPRLRGKPIGVVPMLADTTVCIAASIEAKTFGVKTGTKVAEARRLCPGIEFVIARHEIYIDYHHRAVAVVDSFVPVRAVLSIDEMDCELTGRWREPARALEIAQNVKAGLRAQIGECLRTSIGIGPNTFIAKTASDMVKPDGLVIIEQAELPDRLFGLPVRALSGIGAQMERRLHAKGIRTVKDLAGRTREELHSVWGGVGGDIMWSRIRGEEQHEREGDTHSISHSSVLGPDNRNPEHAYAVLNRLTQKAAMRLRKGSYYAGRISVDVKYLDGGHWGTEMRLVDTQDTKTFLHALDKLWSKRPKTRRTILRVGMALSDFVDEAHHTGSLFAAEDRSKSLYSTVDKLNARFGKQAVYFASGHKARDRGGLHIAFNHIPDPKTDKSTRFEETPLADVLHDNAALAGIDPILTGDGAWSTRVQAATRRVESILGDTARAATRAACADLLAALRAVEHSQAFTPDAIAGEMHAAQAAMSDPATPSAERDRLLVRQHVLQRKLASLAEPSARGIPRIAHLIRTDSSEQDLPLMQYLCYRSVLAHCAGYRVMLHTPSVPRGPRWNTLLPGMEVRVATTPQWLGNRRLVAAAHQSDVWRVRQVIEHGGFYFDWDLLLLRPPEALRTLPCVMALERKENDYLEMLGVSLIGAEPGSVFLRAWLDAMPEVYNPSRYLSHSVVLAHRLALKLQPLVRVLDHRSFYYPGWSAEAVRWLFDPVERLPDADLREHMTASTGIHLFCSHANVVHWARDLTENDIAAARCNLAALMRPYL